MTDAELRVRFARLEARAAMLRNLVVMMLVEMDQPKRDKVLKAMVNLTNAARSSSEKTFPLHAEIVWEEMGMAGMEIGAVWNAFMDGEYSDWVLSGGTK